VGVTGSPAVTAVYYTLAVFWQYAYMGHSRSTVRDCWLTYWLYISDTNVR